MSKIVWKSESGEEHSLKEWQQITGISKTSIYKYYRDGLTVEQAVERYKRCPNKGPKEAIKYKDNCLYTYCTRDKYELPLVVAGSIDELAELTGMKKTSIYPMLSRGDGCVHRIILDEEES